MYIYTYIYRYICIYIIVLGFNAVATRPTRETAEAPNVSYKYRYIHVYRYIDMYVYR